MSSSDNIFSPFAKAAAATRTFSDAAAATSAPPPRTHAKTDPLPATTTSQTQCSSDRLTQASSLSALSPFAQQSEPTLSSSMSMRESDLLSLSGISPTHSKGIEQAANDTSPLPVSNLPPVSESSMEHLVGSPMTVAMETRYLAPADTAVIHRQRSSDPGPPPFSKTAQSSSQGTASMAATVSRAGSAPFSWSLEQPKIEVRREGLQQHAHGLPPRSPQSLLTRRASSAHAAAEAAATVPHVAVLHALAGGTRGQPQSQDRITAAQALQQQSAFYQAGKDCTEAQFSHIMGSSFYDGQGAGSNRYSAPTTLPPRRSLESLISNASASRGGHAWPPGVNRVGRRSSSMWRTTSIGAETPHFEPFQTVYPTARYSASIESPPPVGESSNEFFAPHGILGTQAQSVDISSAAYELLQRLHASAQSYPRVRGLLSTGGRFVERQHSAAPSVGRTMSYEDGDVRLVNLPRGCSFAELVAVLAKSTYDRASNPRTMVASSAITGGTLTDSEKPLLGFEGSSLAVAAAAATVAPNMTDARRVGMIGGGGAGIYGGLRFCTLRYRLPSDPNVWVDVVDDEDVKLMFEEDAEARSVADHTAFKLHLYVQWTSPGSINRASNNLSEDALLAPAYSMFPSNSSSSDSLFGLGEHDIVARKGNTHGDDVSASVAHVHAAHRSAADLRLAEVRTDQLEVILASEVTVYELLGVGTFGDMYKARWRECDVAVKCLNPAAVGLQYTSRSAWLGFLEDANAMGALRHPNLIEVYGVVLPGAPDAGAQLSQQAEHMQRAFDGEHVSLGGRRTSWDFSSTGAVGGAVDLDRLPSINVTGHQRLPGPLANPPAIVMEYMPGRSLKNAIERGDDAVAGKLARVIYALDVARALKYLHSRGVTHYDLKSTNILLGWRHRRPMAKVAGYGLSNRKAGVTHYTPGVTMSRGVLPWAAPELLRSPARVTHKADVYSFGIVLWELWALRSPYSGMRHQDLVSALVNSSEIVRPEIPGQGTTPRSDEPVAGWKDVMRECWAENPEDRPEFESIESKLLEMAKEVKKAQRQPRVDRPEAVAEETIA